MDRPLTKLTVQFIVLIQLHETWMCSLKFCVPTKRILDITEFQRTVDAALYLEAFQSDFLAVVNSKMKKEGPETKVSFSKISK